MATDTFHGATEARVGQTCQLIALSQVQVGLGGLDIEAVESPLIRRAANGDFRFFTVHHLVEGLRIVSDWPASLLDLMDEITASRGDERCGLRELLGPLGRCFDVGARQTPLRALLSEELPRVIRKLGIVAAAAGAGLLKASYAIVSSTFHRVPALCQFGRDSETKLRLRQFHLRGRAGR